MCEVSYNVIEVTPRSVLQQSSILSYTHFAVTPTFSVIEETPSPKDSEHVLSRERLSEVSQ